MTTYSASFQSISKISKWLVNWTIVSIIITFIYFILSYATLYPSTDAQSNRIDFINLFIVSINLVISFVTAIITLFWFYRANKNIHTFGAKEVSTPRMSVIWWFVPILHLWKPYELAQQIWKASNPQIILSSGNEWKKSPSSNIIKIWWILGILSIFIGIFVGIFLPPASAQLFFEPHYKEERIPFLEVFRIMSTTIPVIISAIFYIRMLKQVSAWQEIKAGKSI
jgi:heme/copper-type cytochrome/quinol oxidase subunit 2